MLRRIGRIRANPLARLPNVFGPFRASKFCDSTPGGDVRTTDSKNELMVKIACYANFLVLLVSGTTPASAEDALRITSSPLQSLSTVTLPESVALGALGALLIGGAVLLRRSWISRSEESHHSKAAGSVE